MLKTYHGSCHCGAARLEAELTAHLFNTRRNQHSSGMYRLYSRSKDRRTGRRRNLGTFPTRAAALKHERAVRYFKRRGHA